MNTPFSIRAVITALLFVSSLSLGCAQSHSSGRGYTIRSSGAQGRLGVSVSDVTRQLKEERKLSVDEGAYVLDVEEDSPAEKADIREGDVIVKFDGEKIGDTGDLIAKVRHTKPKSAVSVEVVRKEEHKVVTATVGREPGVRSYSFNFSDRDFPRIPRLPRIPRIPQIPRLGMDHGITHIYGSAEFLGLGVEELSGQLAEYFEVPGKKGVLVTEVEPGTPAEKAGFKAGDVIVKADGNTVRHIEDLREELSGRGDTTLSVEILRKGKSLTLPMKLKEGDGSEGDEDDMSYNLVIPRLRHSADPAPALRHRELTERTLEALREYLREFKDELKSNLRELRHNFETHFPRL